jgi:hypothetical protein
MWLFTLAQDHSLYYSIFPTGESEADARRFWSDYL